MNKVKLHPLVQGDMIVTKYDQKFINLLSFTSGTQLSKEAKVSMLQCNFNLIYKGMMRVKRLKVFVVEVFRIVELDRVVAYKARRLKLR